MFESAEFIGYLILDVTAIRVNFADGTGREACDTFGWSLQVRLPTSFLSSIPPAAVRARKKRPKVPVGETTGRLGCSANRCPENGC